MVESSGFSTDFSMVESSSVGTVGLSLLLATDSISPARLRFRSGWSEAGTGAEDLAFFWSGLFTGVNEEQGGITGPVTSVLTTVDPHSGFFRGRTVGAGVAVLAGVATGLAP